ncbi:lipoprotein [Massilia sp. IC2-278]|uniref:LPS translocon maturation chaperone LptM n=1 Tax=Massilia sp. IC2-278 TaxID=2887200 RepID=UPI001E53C572|nr:lipoprotein [Massilia sp. IC2-278]
MKSPIALFVLIASALTGCGQTGPLYMPMPPARPAPANATLGAMPLATPAPASAPVQTTAPSPGAGTAQPSPTNVPPQQ